MAKLKNKVSLEKYFNIVKKNYDKYINLNKESNKYLEIKNKGLFSEKPFFILSLI